MAGIAAAATNNGIGIAGVSWEARIMPLLRVLEDGAGWISDVIEAINYAVEKGAQVINWSLNPDLSPDGVEDIIKASADKVGSEPYDESGRNDLYRYGRINAETALRMTPHKLWLEPEELSFLADDERAPACRTVSNRGTNASTWEAMTTAEWLSVDGPLPTSLSPGLGLTPSWIDVCLVRESLADYGFYIHGHHCHQHLDLNRERASHRSGLPVVSALSFLRLLALRLEVPSSPLVALFRRKTR